MPKVSIVMPAYNRQDLIAESIASIARQTFRDFDVVVVDDGSTDGTRAAAESALRDHGLNGSVITVPNGGPDAARDRGLERAAGEVMAFLDSDDLWEPDFLETMCGVLQAHPEVPFAFSDFVLWDDATGARQTKSSTLEKLGRVPCRRVDPAVCVFEDSLFEYLLQEQPVFMGALVFTRDALERAGPTTKLIQARIGSLEWEFVLRLSRLGPAAYVDRPLAIIRRHAGNLSGAYVTQTEGEIAVLETVRTQYPLTAGERAIVIREIAARSLSVGYQHLLAGSHARARRALRISLAHRVTLPAVKYFVLAAMPAPLVAAIKRGLGRS